MWTLVGALVLFDERLNGWQWVGVLLAIGSIFLFSFRNRNAIHLKRTESGDNLYYICLALAILIGACSGLYDKYMMRRYDHNAVQVYYTLYQAIMMLGVWLIDRFAIRTKTVGIRGATFVHDNEGGDIDVANGGILSLYGDLTGRVHVTVAGLEAYDGQWFGTATGAWSGLDRFVNGGSNSKLHVSGNGGKLTWCKRGFVMLVQ